uniref:Bestrophin homolog n=1 Tax=Ascaris suum TaxID=6253 RepID=F1LFU3_ASCSU
MRVRRRFPTMQSVMKAGFLLPHELEMLEGIDLKYNKYFVPFNWIFTDIYKLRKAGKIDADVLMNSMLQEIRLFRTNLAELCNYDWVPVPLAYPQVVFLAVRVYFSLYV